jgi:hypothetical protein
MPVDVQCTMDDRVQQNQAQFGISQCTWTKTIEIMKLYIERGADWCGQGKNNLFF